MKKIRVIILVLFLLGCEKQYDDPIPEGAVLGTPNLVANLNEEGKVVLSWDISRFCSGWFCDPAVEGSSYDIFVKNAGANEFEKIDRVGKDQYEYLVPRTEFNKTYEFYVISRRAGQIATSNTVMIVPNPYPKIETVMEIEDSNFFNFPQVNIHGDKVAYLSNYSWDELGQEYGVIGLFVKDLVTGEVEIIQKRCYHPKWSRDGGKLIYGTVDGLSSVVQGYTPIHLEIYDFKTGEISLLKGGRHHNYFPTFAMDNESILFLSDSLTRGEFGLWRLNNNGNSEVLLSQIQQGGQLSNLVYSTSMDASSFSDLVSLDILGEFENRQVYNIYRVDLNSGSNISNLVVSPWTDTSSSFSPFEDDLIAFVSDRSGKSQVWVLEISTGKLKQVSFLNEDLYINSYGNIISWLDNGKSLAFPVYRSSDDRKLVKIQIPS